MMDLKREGQQFPDAGMLILRHPARWCWLRFIWSLLIHRQWWIPRGQAWQLDLHHWSCYMRLRFGRGRPFWHHQHNEWIAVAGLRNWSLEQRTDPWTLNRWVEITPELIEDHPEIRFQ